jgi:hypothetical protein
MGGTKQNRILTEDLRKYNLHITNNAKWQNFIKTWKVLGVRHTLCLVFTYYLIFTRISEYGIIQCRLEMILGYC